MCIDGDRLPASFDAWEGNAHLLRERIEAGGDLVMRIQLEPREFRDWCDERGLAPDAGARHRFAKEAVSAVLGPKPLPAEASGRPDLEFGTSRN